MKSKKILLALILTIPYLSILSAQNQTAQNTNNMRLLFQGGDTRSKLTGTGLHFVNPVRAVEGTVYLFDKWENFVVIHATNQEKLLIRNINLNISNNTFESKIGNDSLFAFSFNNIEKFVINNRVFKNYYWDNDNRVYEVIVDSKGIEILKGFSIRFVEGSPNPMLNRFKDKYVRDEKYYVKKNDKITATRLKESHILKLFDLDKVQKGKVLDHIKDNKLSFKNERDLKAIIEFAQKEI